MKIAIAGVMQESNSFAPRTSVLSDFQIDLGPEVTRVHRGTNTEIGGFVEELDKLKIEIVPLFSAWALPAGPVADADLDEIGSLLLQQIEGADFDGLLLALHGAWISETHASADAELVRRIRTKIGNDIPIVATLDLHANILPSLLEGLWGAVGYRTYPHIDMAETGRKAVHLMQGVLREKKRPEFFWQPLPFMASPQVATTASGPMREVFENLDESLREFGVLSSSFFCVQPWLDIPETTSSFVVAAKSRNSQISEAVERVAARFWERRAELETDWITPENLLNKVKQSSSSPVIVSEAYDATTGGAPGDHPGLLQTLLPHRDEVSACFYMVDPFAEEQARRAGVGGEFQGNIGACLDPRFGSPVSVKGKVIHLSDGVFTMRGPVFTGKKIDMGPTAVLEVGRLSIVIASRAVMTVDPELYRSQGIEPRERRIVAVKSPTLFKPGYADMLGDVLNLDMPGVCRGNLPKVPFQKLSRPYYPLDDFSWQRRSDGLWV